MCRFLTSLILSLALTVVAAAGNTVPLLDRMPGHRVTFGYSYTLIKGELDGPEVTSGVVVVQGNSYKLTGLGLEIVSDGATRWTVDRSAREVLIEPVDSDDPVTNPALFVARYREYGDRLKVHSAGDDSLDVSVSLDEKTVVRFRLSGIVFAGEGDVSDFVLDVEGLGPDYIVTDLR